MTSRGQQHARRKSQQALASKPLPAVSIPISSTSRIQAGNILVAITATVLLVVLSYSNALQNGFTWDDHQQIEMNSGLRPGAPFTRLLLSDVWAFSAQNLVGSPRIYYRPLQMLTYRLVMRFAGTGPLTFHFVSVLFGALAAILCLGLFWILTRQLIISFSAAALFAVHPIHTEAMDWVSSLADLGCRIFVVAAFSLFLLGSRPPKFETSLSRPGKLVLWSLSAFCFAAALLWKETAAAFPLLVWVYLAVDTHKHSITSRLKNLFFSSLAFGVVLAAYLFLRFRVLGNVAPILHTWNLTPLQFMCSAANLLPQYWSKLLMPFPLSAYHVFSPVRSFWSLAALSSFFFALSVITAIIYLFRRRRSVLAFAALWVFITLLPVLDIYALGRNALAERYLYLPSVGFCLFLVLAVQEMLQRLPQRFQRVAAVSAFTIVVCLSVLATRARNTDWKDDAILFARTLETAPTAAFVHNMVAATQAPYAAGSQAAENHYLQALALASSDNPQDRLQMARACEGLASIYSERSDFLRAVDYLERVRRIDPKDPEVDGEEGLILTRAGRWDEAAQYLLRAVAASRTNENVLNALGLLALQHTHQFDEAASYFSRALAIHTTSDDFSASLHNNLGVVYGEKERYTDALEQFRSAVSAAPDDPEYRTNLAMALAATGHQEQAGSELRAVLSLAPDYQPAQNALRHLLLR